MAVLGFVGLGMMGSRMVKRLLDAGYPVTGYNRTKSKAEPLIQAGMQWAKTPREVAQAADVIFSNVADNDALAAVTEGPDGVLAGLSAGKAYTVMSTVSPSLIQELAGRVGAIGGQLLDAPVSGSKLTLEQGKLTIMVSGNQQTYEQVKPFLEIIGPNVMYIGPSGQAMTLKVAINISIVVQVITFAEGVILAEHSGIPRKQAVEVMLNSAITSPALRYRGPFVAEMPEEAWFDVSMAQKDILLAIELSHKMGITLPTAAIADELLAEARRLGYADKDFAVLYMVLEGMSSINQ